MIIAATGHRPKDLPCGYNEDHPWCVDLNNRLLDTLYKHKSSIDYIVSGLALGWDTWFAEAGFTLDIPVVGYVPFPGQERKWPFQSQVRYRNIVKNCHQVITIEDSFSMKAFQTRNQAMVDIADEIWALYYEDKKWGGTYNCIEYANKQKKPIKNFWKNDIYCGNCRIELTDPEEMIAMRNNTYWCITCGEI